MPDRHKTYRLTLTPATEAELLRLKECGENKQLLSRCALWCSSGALEAIIVLRKQRYPYQVGQAGEWGECILPGPWQAIEFDDAQWRAVAVMQGAWVRDWTQRGRRTDLTAQAEPLLPPLPPLQPPDQQQPGDTVPLPDPAALHPTPQPPPMPWVPRESFTCAGLTDKPPRFWRSLADAMPALTTQPRFNESAEAQAERLQLPLLDPRNADHDNHKWSAQPPVKRVCYQSMRPCEWKQTWYTDAFQWVEYKTELVRFLHALRCIVDGTTEYLDVEFAPEMWRLRGGGVNCYPCKNARAREEFDEDPCELCGAGMEEPCQEHCVIPRAARNWWTAYEAELSGQWPAWWSSGGLSDYWIPRRGWCVAQRTLLRVKLLLARMVLNRGDSLAMRCLILAGTPPTPKFADQHKPPLHQRLLHFRGVIHFSNYDGAAKELESMQTSTLYPERRNMDISEIAAKYGIAYGPQPLHYIIESSTFSRNLLGHALSPCDFSCDPIVGGEFTDHLCRRQDGMFDPGEVGDHSLARGGHGSLWRHKWGEPPPAWPETDTNLPAPYRPTAERVARDAAHALEPNLPKPGIWVEADADAIERALVKRRATAQRPRFCHCYFRASCDGSCEPKDPCEEDRRLAELKASHDWLAGLDGPVRLHVRYCHSTNRVVGYEGFQHRKFNWDLEPAQTFLGKWEYGDYFVMDHHAAEDIYHLRENLDFFQTPLDAALRVVEMRGDYQLPTGWRWDSECGPVPPPSPLPTPPPLPPPPRVVAGYTQLPDVHASNPTGSFSIFRRPDEGTWLFGVRDHVPIAALLPRVNRFEELLSWAEERAAANGITLPYQQPGFKPESVMPPVRTPAAAAISSAAAASSSSDDPLDLPPLTADGPVSMQLAEPEGEEELSFMDSVFCDPPPEDGD